MPRYIANFVVTKYHSSTTNWKCFIYESESDFYDFHKSGEDVQMPLSVFSFSFSGDIYCLENRIIKQAESEESTHPCQNITGGKILLKYGHCIYLTIGYKQPTSSELQQMIDFVLSFANPLPDTKNKPPEQSVN